VTIFFSVIWLSKSATIKYPAYYRGENVGGTYMEESLCNVEFLKGPKAFIARVESDLGGIREYRSESFEEVLEQVIIDLQEEFESSTQ
jgi:hypothetical protein